MFRRRGLRQKKTARSVKKWVDGTFHNITPKDLRRIVKHYREALVEFREDGSWLYFKQKKLRILREYCRSAGLAEGPPPSRTRVPETGAGLSERMFPNKQKLRSWGSAKKVRTSPCSLASPGKLSVAKSNVTLKLGDLERRRGILVGHDEKENVASVVNGFEGLDGLKRAADVGPKLLLEKVIPEYIETNTLKLQRSEGMVKEKALMMLEGLKGLIMKGCSQVQNS